MGSTLCLPSCVACHFASAACVVGSVGSERYLFLSPVSHVRVCLTAQIICASVLENILFVVLLGCVFGECHVLMALLCQRVPQRGSTWPGSEAHLVQDLGTCQSIAPC